MKVCFISKPYLFMIFPMIVVTLFVFSYAFVEQAVVGKVIVVDAGHGGIDPGANRPGVVEKDINLAIALQVRDILRKYNVKVILTRDIDRDLSELCDNEKVRGRYHRDLNARIEAIQESDADLFVSIHANTSSNSQRRGIECYYAGKSETGKALAFAVQEQAQNVAPISQQAKPADFFVLRRNKVPAVLVEVGFITNPEEQKLLQSPEYQRKLADAIVAGIRQYYSSSLVSWNKK